jgi:hypothetical protein
MIKQETPASECREAIRRLVDVLQCRDDFDGAIEGAVADLSDEAKAWAAATYLNQAARESFRIIVRAAEIGAASEAKTYSRVRGVRTDHTNKTFEVEIEQKPWEEEPPELEREGLKAYLIRLGLLTAAEQNYEFRLTATLLDSRFTLRNGTFVSWGDATVAQHQERIDLFADLAKTNLEGMMRHAKAVELIRSHGVDTLRQVTNC